MLVAWEGQEEKNRYKLVENKEKHIQDQAEFSHADHNQAWENM